MGAVDGGGLLSVPLGELSGDFVFGQQEQASSIQKEPWANILTPEESLARIQERLDTVSKFEIKKSGPDFYAMAVLHKMFLLALAAHAEVLEHQKDAPQICSVVWNEKTGFPSEGTLLADAAWLGGTKQGKISALLQSFGNWSFWREEKVRCDCRRIRKFRRDDAGEKELKEDTNSILVRHNLGLASDQTLLFRGAAAVYCDRPGHLAHYEGSGKTEKINKNMVAVSFTDVVLTLNGGIFNLTLVRNEGADEEEEFARTLFHKELLVVLEENQCEVKKWIR